VESKNGAVELTLPPTSNFQIQADSRHGEVECDFSGPGLKLVKEGDAPSISGSYGKGGPMIHINTDYGAIRILRTNSQSPAPRPTPEPSGKAQTTWNHRAQHHVPAVRVQHTGSTWLRDGLVKIAALARATSPF